MKTVHIDGSMGEGGGQVLRTSLSLAAILGCELVINNIRAGRSKPGLSAQHVTCVRAAAAVSNADIEGDELRSQKVRMRPRGIVGGNHSFDVAAVHPSAGSTSLVLQAILPVLLFAPDSSRVVIEGGTNVRWSPTYEYLNYVFLPALGQFGASADIARDRGGWYPKGGGRITSRIQPVNNLQPVDLNERGELDTLKVISTVSQQLPDHIVKRQAKSAIDHLPDDVAPAAETVYRRPAGGTGTCLAIAAQFRSGHAGATALGERGRPAEKVGAEAARAFNAFLQTGAAVDEHLADQLLLYAAVAEGESRILAEKDTQHLRTNAAVIREFTHARIAFEGESPCRIRVKGIGMEAN